MSRKEIPVLDLVRSTFLWIVLLSTTLVYGLLVMPFVLIRAPRVVHWFARMWGKTLRGTMNREVERQQAKREKAETVHAPSNGAAHSVN